MIPILYDGSTVVGFLKDAISCEVTEERNGVYELQLTYPIAGQMYSEISINRYIKAKPNDTSELQLFRIEEIEKPINGVITVNATHISYLLNKYPISNVEIADSTPQAIISQLLLRANNNLQTSHGFTAWSNITSTNAFNYAIGTVRSALGGSEGSLLDLFGGEYEFDNKVIKFHQSRGTDNGVIIAYGKNLTDVKLTISDDASYTALMPYLVHNDIVYTLDDPIQVDNDSGISEKVFVRDFSSEIKIDDGTTEAQIKTILNAYALIYLDNNDINSLTASCDVSFLHLWQSPEYKNFAALEHVSLCDAVTVYHKDLGINIKTKVVKTVYDALSEKYIKIELGTIKSDLSSVLTENKNTITTAKKDVQRTSKIVESYNAAVANATEALNGTYGGFFVQNPPINPYELLIIDRNDITEADNVWRWNIEGFGFSSDGYNGPYRTAITKDGRIIANEIYALTTTSVVVNTGIIQTSDGESYWNLSGNDFYCGYSSYATRITGGRIKQYNKGDNLEIGGITAVYNANSQWFQAVYYTEHANGGLAFDRFNTVTGVITKALDLTVAKGSFAGVIETNTNLSNTFAGLKHYRSTSEFDANVGFGVGAVNGDASIGMEMKYNSNDNIIIARADIVQNDHDLVIGSTTYKGVCALRMKSKGYDSGLLYIGQVLEWNSKAVFTDDVLVKGVSVSSTEDIKTNITETDNQSVIDLFKQSKIYKYRYKTPAELESESVSGKDIMNAGTDTMPAVQDDTANCMGFVIGRETPNEVISSDGEHIDLYTMASVNWKATQEILTRLEALEGKQ